MFKWLRSLGPFGSFLANAIALLATNWGIVVSVIIGIGAGLWTLASAWIQNPRVQSGVEVFLAILWTYIGFVVLRSHKMPTTVRVFHDYAYALAYEAATPGLDPEQPDLISFVFVFRNVGVGPIKARVEDLRVIFDGRTADHPEMMSKEFIVPRVTAKTYRSALIPWDKKKNRANGTADITILYGHPEIGYERKLRIKLELAMGIENERPVGFSAGIISETDSPYRSS